MPMILDCRYMRAPIRHDIPCPGAFIRMMRHHPIYRGIRYSMRSGGVENAPRSAAASSCPMRAAHLHAEGGAGREAGRCACEVQ